MKANKDPYSLLINDNRKVFLEGMKDAIPINLGYFAVAFSLGIMAKTCGLSPLQAMVASLLNNASAGEFAGFTLIGSMGTYAEMVLIILIANGRYLLMSFAMSQRLDPNIKFYHRALMAFDINDELFAIAIARKGYLNPNYTYGAVLCAAPGWATGTFAGCYAGNVMPDRIVSALSVALFGMFLAVVIPAAKQEKSVAIVVVASFVISFAFKMLPVVSSISEGNKTIILTIIIASAAAILFPHKEDPEHPDEVVAIEEAVAELEHREHKEVK